MMRPAHAASSSLFHLAILQHQISDKVFDLVSDPQKREEVMAELTKTLDPAEQEVRVYVCLDVRTKQDRLMPPHTRVFSSPFGSAAS